MQSDSSRDDLHTLLLSASLFGLLTSGSLTVSRQRLCGIKTNGHVKMKVKLSNVSSIECGAKDVNNSAKQTHGTDRLMWFH